MKLAVIARYFSLNEAQVVGSLLRACGFQASVADEIYGSVVWTAQPFLNGFRILVPWHEAADAVAVLRDVAPPPAPTPRPPLRWTFWLLLLPCFLSNYGTWAWVAWRRQPTLWRSAGFLLLVMPLWLIIAFWLWLDLLRPLLRLP